MSFIATLQRGREVLEQQGRLSVRALGRELGLAGDALEDLGENIADVERSGAGEAFNAAPRGGRR